MSGDIVDRLKQARISEMNDHPGSAPGSPEKARFVERYWAMHDGAEEIERLRRDVALKQAKIDALMLEHCPGEMTPEQVAEWGRHQQQYHLSDAEQQALNRALKRSVRFLDSETGQTASGSPLNARSD